MKTSADTSTVLLWTVLVWLAVWGPGLVLVWLAVWGPGLVLDLDIGSSTEAWLLFFSLWRHYFIIKIICWLLVKNIQTCPTLKLRWSQRRVKVLVVNSAFSLWWRCSFIWTLTASPVSVKSTKVSVLLLALVLALHRHEGASLNTVRRHTSAKSTISLYISAAWQ